MTREQQECVRRDHLSIDLTNAVLGISTANSEHVDWYGVELERDRLSQLIDKQRGVS